MQLRFVLFSLLAAALVAALLLGWDEIFPGPLEDGADPAAQGPPELLQAEGPGDVAARPGLEGRTGSEAEALRAKRGDVEVLVLGRGGAPFPGALVVVRTVDGRVAGDVADHVEITDFDGRVVFRDQPYDGSRVLGIQALHQETFFGDRPASQAPRVGTVPITGPRHTYMAETGFWMTVRVVDAESGRLVKGAQLRGDDSREKDNKAWVKAPARFFVVPPVPPITRHAHLGFTTAPLAGWSLWESNEVRTVISPYARELLYIYPMRRELPLTVALVDSEGRAMEATYKELKIGDVKPRHLSWDTDAFGRLVFKGVPWLRDELVLLEVASKDKERTALDVFRIPPHEGARVSRTMRIDTHVVLHGDLPRPFPLGGAVGGKPFGGRTKNKRDKELIVRVLRRDGAPAVDCRVAVDDEWPGVSLTTDARGRAHFRGLRSGKVLVVARQAGLLPMTGGTKLSSGKVTKLTLREGSGGSLDIEVVDDDGKPLSYATLRVATPSRLPWLDVHDGIQRLDPFADHRGRRTLEHVEPGSILIHTYWGSRKGEQRLKLAEGERKSVRIVLPKPHKFKGEGK